MIINKLDKSFQTRSDCPNYNWELDDDKFFTVDDNSEISKKILKYAPHFDLVLSDDKNNILDVIEKIDEETLNEIEIDKCMKELEHYDSIIPRWGEYLFEKLKIEPHETVKEIISKKENIREKMNNRKMTKK